MIRSIYSYRPHPSLTSLNKQVGVTYPNQPRQTGMVKKDLVSVSHHPNLLMKYRGQVETELETLSQRVETVKQQLQNGTYEIDLDAITRALMS